MSPVFDVGQDGGRDLGDVVERRSYESNRDVNRRKRKETIFDHMETAT